MFGCVLSGVRMLARRVNCDEGFVKGMKDACILVRVVNRRAGHSF